MKAGAHISLSRRLPEAIGGDALEMGLRDRICNRHRRHKPMHRTDSGAFRRAGWRGEAGVDAPSAAVPATGDARCRGDARRTARAVPLRREGAGGVLHGGELVAFQLLLGHSERGADFGDLGVDLGNRAGEPAVAFDEQYGKTAGGNRQARTTLRRRPANSGTLDLGPQTPLIVAQSLRQRFEPGEMAPPFLALPAVQTETIFHRAHLSRGLIFSGTFHSANSGRPDRVKARRRLSQIPKVSQWR